jgi:hypothetical protein
MPTQLKTYIEANGPAVTVKGKRFTVEGFSGDGDFAIATIKAVRAEYIGVLCINARVPRLPGAEVWSIMGGRREIARFAVADNAIVALT